MLVIEIDDIDTEPLQARLAGLRHVSRAAIDAVGAARPPRLAEFGGDDDAVAPALQRPAEQLLVLAPAIHVRTVKMIDTEFERVMDQRHPVCVIAFAIDPGQRHAAEPNRRHLGPVLAEPSTFRHHFTVHRLFLSSVKYSSGDAQRVFFAHVPRHRVTEAQGLWWWRLSTRPPSCLPGESRDPWQPWLPAFAGKASGGWDACYRLGFRLVENAKRSGRHRAALSLSKTSSGKKALTTILGTSTNSLIFRSTETLQIA